MWLTAVTLWISDRVFCSFWLSISFPYLHALWHILIAINSNEAIVVVSYLVVKYQDPEANLHLHFWPSEQWRWLTIPYLKFQEDSNGPSTSSWNYLSTK